MRLNVKHDKHVPLTEDLKDYLDKKLDALAKFVHAEDEEALLAEIELSKPSKHQSGPFFRAEINLNAHGTLFRAVAEEQTIEAAIDKMKDEVLRELRRTKRKKHTLVKKGGVKGKEMMRGLPKEKK